MGSLAASELDEQLFVINREDNESILDELDKSGECRSDKLPLVASVMYSLSLERQEKLRVERV